MMALEGLRRASRSSRSPHRDHDAAKERKAMSYVVVRKSGGAWLVGIKESREEAEALREATYALPWEQIVIRERGAG